eukprot:TRINITY_DN9559_c1_g2_i1.p1 TRINITY_DN9559_c1_g2~~TRINITY_DN9559_c1_g2_i1.p1  ORF type:complete len:336 (+),score=67.01 TRINITY_DN9559_c1_g2_i1:62-1069(+)
MPQDEHVGERKTEETEPKTKGAKGDAATLGAFFAPAKRKTRLKRTERGGSSSCSGSDFESASEASSCEESETESQSSEKSKSSSEGSTKAPPPDLGDFFSPAKRKSKTRLATKSAPNSSAAPEAAVTQAFSSSTDCDSSSSCSRTAASRAAWKRRGQEGGYGLPPERGSYSGSSSSFRPEDRSSIEGPLPTARASKSKQRAATGMFRAAPRLGQAVDSTRCHWLMPPESLLNRVDPETSDFLSRLWLSQAGRSRYNSANRADGTPRKKCSYPARIHAGWLREMLRPRGWLASIPEEEQRSLPMPEDVIGEPDRGPCRPNTAVLEKVILRELKPSI